VPVAMYIVCHQGGLSLPKLLYSFMVVLLCVTCFVAAINSSVQDKFPVTCYCLSRTSTRWEDQYGVELLSLAVNTSLTVHSQHDLATLLMWAIWRCFCNHFISLWRLSVTRLMRW